MIMKINGPCFIAGRGVIGFWYIVDWLLNSLLQTKFLKMLVFLLYLLILFSWCVMILLPRLLILFFLLLIRYFFRCILLRWYLKLLVLAYLFNINPIWEILGTFWIWLLLLVLIFLYLLLHLVQISLYNKKLESMILVLLLI